MPVFSYFQGSVAGTATGTGPIGSTGYGVSLRGYEPIVTVTASKTLAMPDSGTVQNCINAAAAILTIPLNSAEPFPIGAKVIIRKTTAQTVTIAWSTGVTVLNSLGVTLSVTSVTSATIIRKTDVDIWIAFSDLPETAIGGALRAAVDSTSAKSTIGLALVNNVPLAEPRSAGIQIGTGAGLSNTSSTGWTAIGASAGRLNTTGANWTAIGNIAGYSSTTGGNWTAIGYFAGFSNTTGGNWAAIGYGAGSSNTTGANWTAIGYNAGPINTTGGNWTAIGSYAAASSTTGSSWTAIGYGAAYSSTTGSSWTAIGNNAGYKAAGNSWVAIGDSAGYNNATGGNWAAIGSYAAASNSSGSGFTAVGYGAGYSSTTGSNWTTIGYNTGVDLTTGSTNTMVGANTGRGVTTGSGNTVIGAGVTGLAAALENTVIISSGDGIPKIFSDSTGLKVGVNSSDSRIKLTSPNGTVYAFAVNDSGVLFKV